MKQVFEFIFYSDAGSTGNNIALLCFRILLGFELFRVHGIKKFKLVNGEREHVPNPFHLPEQINRSVATFSDTVVPFLLALGIATRIVLLPVTGVTAVGYFIVHGRDTAEVRDVPFMYTLCFLLLIITGPGTYSADNYIFVHFIH